MEEGLSEDFICSTNNTDDGTYWNLLTGIT